ncbi:hypothetical protein CW304_26145 [Bacillus sp. UFRGS-B20]|nr:hypothetical protein CW304_26145 [Bacillus sp. UFRGS-B20]
MLSPPDEPVPHLQASKLLDVCSDRRFLYFLPSPPHVTFSKLLAFITFLFISNTLFVYHFLLDSCVLLKNTLLVLSILLNAIGCHITTAK